MQRSRILPLLGPLFALYLVADAAAVANGLNLAAWLIAVVAVVLTLAPLWLRADILAEVKGARRTGTLGVASGVAAAASLTTPGLSLVQDASLPAALAMMGLLVVDLATDVPDRRGGRLRPLVITGALVSVALSLSAIMPLPQAWGELMIVPAKLRHASPIFAVVALAMGLALRVARRWQGSGPEALASNMWAILGTTPALAAYGSAVGLRIAVERSEWVPFLVAAGGIAAQYGHTTLVDASKRLNAGLAARQIVAAVVALSVAGASAPWLVGWIPRDPYVQSILAALWVLAVAGLWRFSLLGAHRLLAPAGGRLLDAISVARGELNRAATLEQLGVAVLGPIRDAAGPGAMPLLLTVDPAREIKLDAARQGHARPCEMSPALLNALTAAPGELIMARDVSSAVVRNPKVRPLADFLETREAQCVVPLAVDGDVEGALLVARGQRGSPLSLEEMGSLLALGAEVASRLVLFASRDRLRRRVSELAQTRDRLDERVEELEEQREQLRADANVLGAGRGQGRRVQPPIAYSAPMRSLLERAATVAATDAPVLVVAEGGSPVDRLARHIHAQSLRGEGPFVVADCGAVPTDQSEVALFGDQNRPGWLRLAHGGSLLLADVIALSQEAQRALAESLAIRQGRVAGGVTTYPIDVRIIATSRLRLSHLVELGRFDAELARWLDPLQVEMPPLRERAADIPSLVLLALDRAARVFGREPVGIEQAAMDVLLEHSWPGNLRELQHVVEQAVRGAQGDQIRPEELPPLPQRRAPVQPLDGTYAELEKRILIRAIERANGNKSEAARLLGLKRTTFLDKLRRQKLDPASHPN